MDRLKKSASALAFERAQICIGGNMLEKAREHLEQAASYDDTDTGIYKLMGLIDYAHGEFAAAGAYWRKASSDEYLAVMEGDDFSGYVKAYDKSVEYVNVRKHLKAAVELYRIRPLIPDTNGYRFAGLVFAKIGLINLAVNMWIEALKIDRDDHLALDYILSFDKKRVPMLFEKIFMGVMLLAARSKLL